MLLKFSIPFTITLLLLTMIVTASDAEQDTKTRQDSHPSKVSRDYQPMQQFEPRFAMDQLPKAGKSIESYLKYCEAVIHALESGLPSKSGFRALFYDKTRLSSGYDKHVKFSYYDLLKNLPGQEY